MSLPTEPRRSLLVPPANEPRCFRRGDEVLALGDSQTEHPQPEADRDADGQVGAERLGQNRQRKPEQQGDEKADQQAHDRGHEFGG